MIAPFQPLGGDFINLYAAAKLILTGQIDAIYNPDAFMAFEHTIIPADIGLRMWAYPPHSLFFVWPFGLLPFVPAFALWSVFGLGVLAIAARRYGFSRLHTGLLVCSPAVISCVLLGQTGNFAAGLMLLALSARKDVDPVAIGGAALLTLKPQSGFLVPLLWMMRGQWRLIGISALVIALIAVASWLAFGGAVWMAYINDTAPLLAAQEKDGTGPFMLMIPSVFMAGRILGLAGGQAIVVHAGFAMVVLAWLVWRLRTVRNRRRQDALLLVATCLITPYLHLYDLSLLSVAALIILRDPDGATGWRGIARNALLVFAWFLPALVLSLNAQGLPVSPLALLGFFALI